MTFAIGIDPGTNTGFAVWDCDNRKLIGVESGTILTIMRQVKALHEGGPAMPGGSCLVVFEDCREHRIFFPTGQRNDGALQGVGSVKRDCGIWEEFLRMERIPYITQKPNSRRTKFTAAQFAATTGWTDRSNEHGRDAALLVAGLAADQVRAWMGGQGKAGEAGHDGERRGLERPGAERTGWNF